MSELLAAYQKLVYRHYLLAGLVIGLVAFGEIAFDIVERVVGRYLVWQNAGREKIGRSWEDKQKQFAADARLENVTRERRRQALELESISNFEELALYVETNPQTVISDSLFLQIYYQLPYFLQPLLFNADSLVKDARTLHVARVVIDGNRSQLNVVMLDANSQTVRRAALNAEQMRLLMKYGKEQPVNIRSESRFADYLFSAEEFWNLFESLHPLRRRQFIQDVPLLTQAAGQITAVGISSQSTNEFVEVALAVSETRAYLYYLPEDYLMDLLEPDRARAYEFFRARRR